MFQKDCIIMNFQRVSDFFGILIQNAFIRCDIKNALFVVLLCTVQGIAQGCHCFAGTGGDGQAKNSSAMVAESKTLLRNFMAYPIDRGV